jgi:hypothetical protein
MACALLVSGGVFAPPAGAAVPDAPGPSGVLCVDGRDCRLTMVARLRNAPFPYDGRNGDSGVAFFDGKDDATGQRAHSVTEGLAYPERPHYRDDRVLIHVPPDFDPSKRFHYMVFFHGHDSEIVRTVIDDLQVVRQVNDSHRNVVLVAPQLAREARDSSPGKLWRPAALARLMDEVANVLTDRFGKRLRGGFTRAPIVLAGFSGGFRATAYSLDRGGVGPRIAGVLLLDALYGDIEMFAGWLGRSRRHPPFLALHGESSRPLSLSLADRMAALGHKVVDQMPPTLSAGTCAVVAVDSEHWRVPVDGPPRDPVAEFLRRLPR